MGALAAPQYPHGRFPSDSRSACFRGSSGSSPVDASNRRSCSRSARTRSYSNASRLTDQRWVKASPRMTHTMNAIAPAETSGSPARERASEYQSDDTTIPTADSEHTTAPNAKSFRRPFRRWAESSTGCCGFIVLYRPHLMTRGVLPAPSDEDRVPPLSVLGAAGSRTRSCVVLCTHNSSIQIQTFQGNLAFNFPA